MTSEADRALDALLTRLLYGLHLHIGVLEGEWLGLLGRQVTREIRLCLLLLDDLIVVPQSQTDEGLRRIQPRLLVIDQGPVARGELPLAYPAAGIRGVAGRDIGGLLPALAVGGDGVLLAGGLKVLRHNHFFVLRALVARGLATGELLHRERIWLVLLDLLGF